MLKKILTLLAIFSNLHSLTTIRLESDPNSVRSPRRTAHTLPSGIQSIANPSSIPIKSIQTKSDKKHKADIKELRFAKNKSKIDLEHKNNLSTGLALPKYFAGYDSMASLSTKKQILVYSLKQATNNSRYILVLWPKSVRKILDRCVSCGASVKYNAHDYKIHAFWVNTSDLEYFQSLLAWISPNEETRKTAMENPENENALNTYLVTNASLIKEFTINIGKFSIPRKDYRLLNGDGGTVFVRLQKLYYKGSKVLIGLRLASLLFEEGAKLNFWNLKGGIHVGLEVRIKKKNSENYEWNKYVGFGEVNGSIEEGMGKKSTKAKLNKRRYLASKIPGLENINWSYDMGSKDNST